MSDAMGSGARTASEAVAEQIRGRIATGAISPGGMLPSETTLLEEFGVARPTMREALRILESDGLITILRGVNGGAQVREPDVATLARRAGLYLQMQNVHMGDLMAALRIIQPGAVALAASAATEVQLAALRDQVDRVAATTEVDAFTDEATEFLNSLVQVSGNHTLALLSALLNRLVQAEARAFTTELPPNEGPGFDDDFKAWCVDQYLHLISLIEAGDAAEAEAFWGRHLDLMPPAVNGNSALTVYPAHRRR